jgi:hypothetical protein
MMPVGETVSPYQMNPQLAMYLRGGRASGNPTISQIDAGAMQGIAGGLAQLGTVHGQTPDVSPFTKALASTAQQPKTDIDPKVVEYLMGNRKEKVAPWKAVGKTPDGRIIYSNGTEERVGDIKSYIPPREMKEPKQPKVNEAEYRIDLSMQNAMKLRDLISKHGTVDMGVPGAEMDKAIFELAIDFAKVADPESVAREGEVAAAQKYMLPIRKYGGMRYSNKEAIKLVDNYMADLQARKNARERNTPGVGTGQAPNQSIQQKPSGGQVKDPTDPDAKAEAWAKKNPNDPRSQKIFDKLKKKKGGMK